LRNAEINPLKKAAVKAANPVSKVLQTDIIEFFHLIRAEKKDFFKVLALSGVTSLITMLFPKALKEITHLASLRNDPDESTDGDFQKSLQSANEKSKEKKERGEKGSFFIGNTHETRPEIRNEYLKFLGVWVPIFIVSGFLTYYRRLYISDIGNRVAYRLRYKLYSDLISKDLSFFINKKSASTDYVHKLSNDITTISNGITNDISWLLRSIIFSVGSTGYILIYGPQLAFASMLVMGGLTFGTRNVLKQLRESKVKEAEALTNLSVIAGERLSNMKLIKVNNTEDFEKKHYLNNLHKFYDESYKVSKYGAMNYGLMDGLGQLSVIGLLAYGSFLVTMGHMGSEMISLSMYALYAGLGFRGIFNSITELKKSAGLYNGIFNIIGSVKDDKTFKVDFKNFERIVEDEEHSVSLDNRQRLLSPPSIEFQNVSFSYLESPILKSLSLSIKPGSIVAITGSSGSGKTTILNLLTKLYEADAGKILVNGREISEIDPVWVRINVSYVTQEPILFMGSILDNIKYGNDSFDTSMENVLRAAKLANAHDFISSLPEGYETRIGEKGLTLSGGQRQKIVLARALVKDPKIFILDESTSSLDAASEKSIIEGLKTVCQDRTCLIVTHKIENYLPIITDHIQLQVVNPLNPSAQSEKIETKVNDPL